MTDRCVIPIQAGLQVMPVWQLTRLIGRAYAPGPEVPMVTTLVGGKPVCRRILKFRPARTRQTIVPWNGWKDWLLRAHTERLTAERLQRAADSARITRRQVAGKHLWALRDLHAQDPKTWRALTPERTVAQRLEPESVLPIDIVRAYLEMIGIELVEAAAVEKSDTASERIPAAEQHALAILDQMRSLEIDPMDYPRHTNGGRGTLKQWMRKRTSLTHDQFDSGWKRLRDKANPRIRESAIHTMDQWLNPRSEK